jgi:hypothetical protein
MRIRVTGHNTLDYSNNNQEELNEYFIHMCSLGNLEKIKYILESPNFNGIDRPDPYSNNAKGFNLLIRREHTEIIDYLIFQYHIEKTKDIEEILAKHNSSYSESINNKFILQEVNKSLNVDLPNNEVKAKKNKV